MINLIKPNRCVLLACEDGVRIYNSGAVSTKLISFVSWEQSGFVGKVSEIIVKDCKSKPVMIVFDTNEQYFRKEKIPANIGILDRQGVIKRKVAFAFPQHKVVGYKKLENHNRKIAVTKKDNDNEIPYMMVAIADDEKVNLLTEAVKDSFAPIIGLFSLPVESATLVSYIWKKISKNNPNPPRWALFAGQHANGSLRQIVIKDGEIVLTRMTPINDPENSAVEWAEDITREIQFTMGYLQRFGFSQVEGIDVILVAETELTTLVNEQMRIECNFVPMTVEETMSYAGIKRRIDSKSDEIYADLIHVTWIAGRHISSMHFHSGEMEKITNVRRAWAASLIMFSLLILYISALIYSDMPRIIGIKSDIKKSVAELSKLKENYSLEVKKKEAIGLDIELVQGSMESYTSLKEVEIDVLHIIKSIGDALQEDFKIDSLTVERIKSPEDVVELSKLSETNRRRRTPRISDRIKTQDTIYELSFSMRLPFSKGPRVAIKIVEELEQKISEQLPDHKVVISKYPRDFSYDKVVAGDIGKNNSNKAINEDYVGEITIRKLAEK